MNQFKQNSARAWVPAGFFGGSVPSGKIIQWYQFDGSANVMMFLVTNMKAFPTPIRINVQTFQSLLNSLHLVVTGVVLTMSFVSIIF